MSVIPRGLGPCVPVCNADTLDWTARYRVLYVTRAFYVKNVICRPANQLDKCHTRPCSLPGEAARMSTSAEHTNSPTDPDTMSHTFDQLKSAIEGQTPCQLIKTQDEDGDRTYTLLDGCGDPMGDAFPDLDEVYFYVSNNDQVREELQCDS